MLRVLGVLDTTQYARLHSTMCVVGFITEGELHINRCLYKWKEETERGIEKKSRRRLLPVDGTE